MCALKIVFIVVFLVVSLHAADPGQKLWPVTRDGKYGYVDANDRIHKGTLILPAIYDRAFRFHDGLARVILAGKTRYITTDATAAIPQDYLDGTDFGNDRAGVKDQDGWLLIDATGKTICRLPDCLAMSAFSEGFAAVQSAQKGHLWGYIAVDGTVISPPRFDLAKDFKYGFALVLTATPTVIDGRDKTALTWNFLDPHGNFLFKESFDEAEAFTDDIIPTKVTRKGQRYLAFRNGDVLTQEQVDERDAKDQATADATTASEAAPAP